MSSLMSHIKMAEMRATDEGCDLLARLIRSPGRPVSADDVTDRSLMESIQEGGGSVWWCEDCDVLCSPNRPCACAAAPSSQSTDAYLLSLKNAELQHVLRALKFCKHSKEKTKLHPKDREWIDDVTKIISRIEEEK